VAVEPTLWAMGIRSLLVLLMALALSGTGCGGSNEVDRAADSPPQSATEQQAPTREAFVSEAKAICTKAWETVPAGASKASLQKQLEMGMDTWSDVVRQLRILPVPPGEKARVGRMLTHFENAIRAGRLASTADDESALAVFAGLFDQGQKGAAIAHSYGLDVCSPVPAMPSDEDVLESEAFQKAMKDFARQVEDSDVPTLTQP
jgi:hypothetical protein